MTRDDYIKKLSSYYDTENKLVQYPSKKPMRILALVRIAEKLEIGRIYSEKEVNEAIRESIAFQDIETIRREMYQFRLIGRLRDGSQYWLEEGWESVYEEYERINSGAPADNKKTTGQ